MIGTNLPLPLEDFTPRGLRPKIAERREEDATFCVFNINTNAAEFRTISDSWKLHLDALQSVSFPILEREQ
jgi:hypothetical protein